MNHQALLMPKFKEAIESKFGEKISYTYQCEALQKSILQSTGEQLGLTTLKRIFGFVAGNNLPRRSTLDILSKYIGYQDFSDFENMQGHGSFASSFVDAEKIETENLKPGDIVELKYHPDRRLKIKYLGDNFFIVISSTSSKLMKDDRLKISQMVKGFEFFVSDVVRDGKSLGSYAGAKQGGIISLHLLKQ